MGAKDRRATTRVFGPIEKKRKVLLCGCCHVIRLGWCWRARWCCRSADGWLPARDFRLGRDAPGCEGGGGRSETGAALKTSDIKPETFVIPANAEAPQLLKKIHEIAALRPQFESRTTPKSS